VVHTPPPKRGAPVGLIVAAVVVLGALGLAVAAGVAWKVGLFKRGRTTMSASAASGAGAVAPSTGGAVVPPGPAHGSPVAGETGAAAGGGPVEVEAGGQALPSRPVGEPQGGSGGPNATGDKPVARVPAAAGAQPRSGGEPAAGARPQGGETAPAPRGVVVVGFGEPLLAGEAERFVERSLGDAGVLVVDEKAIPEVAQALDNGAGPADLAQAFSGRIHYLVTVRAEFVGERQLQYMGRSDTAYQARLQVRSVDLQTGTTVGPTLNERVEYTQLNVGRAVEAQLRPHLRKLRASLVDR